MCDGDRDGDMAILYYYLVDTEIMSIQLPKEIFVYSNHSILNVEAFS